MIILQTCLMCLLKLLGKQSSGNMQPSSQSSPLVKELIIQQCIIAEGIKIYSIGWIGFFGNKSGWDIHRKTQYRSQYSALMVQIKLLLQNALNLAREYLFAKENTIDGQ